MPEDQKDFRHIVRVANVDLDGNKPILSALRKIKGVSFMFANMILSFTGIPKSKKTGTLTDKESEKLSEVLHNPQKFGAPIWMLNRRNDYEEGIDKHILGPDVKFTLENDLKRLKKIKSNRGLRHQWGLPVRGQRTGSNFRKNKGNAMGVKRKKAAAGKK